MTFKFWLKFRNTKIVSISILVIPNVLSEKFLLNLSIKRTFLTIKCIYNQIFEEFPIIFISALLIFTYMAQFLLFPDFFSDKISIFYNFNILDAPRVLIGLGKSISPNTVYEAGDVYFDCKVQALPPSTRISWIHNVRLNKY